MTLRMYEFCSMSGKTPNKKDGVPAQPVRAVRNVVEQVNKQIAKYHELGNQLNANLQMAVVHSTRDGYVKYEGSKLLCSVLEKRREEFLEDSAWLEASEDEVSKVILPRLPARIGSLNLRTLQSILANATRNVLGEGYTGWGKEGRRPEWWPDDVPFVDPKRRPEGIEDLKTWSSCLRKVLSSLHVYYKFNPLKYIEVNSPESGADMPEKGQPDVSLEGQEGDGDGYDASMEENGEEEEIPTAKRPRLEEDKPRKPIRKRLRQRNSTQLCKF